MTSEMNSFYNMTSTATSSLVDDEDEEMNFTSIFNETNIENYTSPSIIEDAGDEMTFTMYSVLCIKGFIFGSIIIGAVLGNALVILAVRRNRKLRYDYKLFELSLGEGEKFRFAILYTFNPMLFWFLS